MLHDSDISIDYLDAIKGGIILSVLIVQQQHSVRINLKWLFLLSANDISNGKELILADRMYNLIILSCYQHGYFWASLATPPFLPLLLAGLPGIIQYLHRAAVCMFELDALPLLVPVKGFHRTTSLTSSSLLLQQCPAGLVCLLLIVFVINGWWPYSCCFVGMLSPGLIQNCSNHSCVIAVRFFLHTFC